MNPSHIINAAALTNVDQCHDNPDIAYQFNKTIVHNLMLHKKKNCKFIQISTDQLYPNVQGPHKESSADPLNVYGASKLAGEKIALQDTNSLVLRVNIFGKSITDGRLSLSDFIIHSLRDKKNLTLFRDSIFSPLHFTTLSKLIEKSLTLNLKGTFNLGSNNGMSKADFGIKIAEKYSLPTDTITVDSCIKYMKSPRPLDMRMDSSYFERTTGIQLPSLNDEILSYDLL